MKTCLLIMLYSKLRWHSLPGRMPVASAVNAGETLLAPGMGVPAFQYCGRPKKKKG